MNLLCSLPLFMIISCLFCAALCLLLKRTAAFAVTGILLLALTAADLAVTVYTAGSGSFTYPMGEFPAPWGNEIRAGSLEGIILAFFLIILFCALLGGFRYLKLHIDGSKHDLFCSLLCLVSAAACALVFTNDIFTGYVFLEIMTLASCGLLISRQVGRTTLAAIRYMIMNLLGSGLYLLGVIMLYGMTGHLLMVHIRETLAGLAGDPSMTLSLTFAVGVLTIGLAIKSGLFPFYFWMPDTYGWATPSAGAVLSSVVSKAYLFLLIKVYYRAVGPALTASMPIETLLLVLGIAGVIFGSLSALRADDLNRMIAFSSAAQIGYIFMSMGIGGDAGYTAALFHLIAHGVTKSLLFLTSPYLADASGGSLRFRDLRGSALRSPAAGFFFLAGALSMVGFPLLAGFTSKILIASAASGPEQPGLFIVIVIVLAVSTLLNALYFLRTVVRIYARPEDGAAAAPAAKASFSYLLPAVILLACNFLLGIFPTVVTGLIEQGLHMFV